jgi:ribosomal protein S27AE
MIGESCPGAANIWGTPTLKIKKCPECGSEVEVFSNDVKVKCEKCGFTVYNDILSCILWCKYAKDCVGEEMYDQLMTERDEKEGKGNGKEKKADD